MPGGREKTHTKEKGPHPLEGKYIVLNFTQCDLEQESTVPVLYRVTGGVWRAVTEPSWTEIHYRSKVLKDFEEDLRLLKTKGVTEILAPNWYGDYFLGSDTFVDLDDPSTHPTRDEIKQWVEFTPVGGDDEISEELKDITRRVGLRVRKYEATEADTQRPPPNKNKKV